MKRLLLTLALLLAIASGAHAAPAFVQRAGGGAGSCSGDACTISMTGVTAGHLIVVMWCMYPSSTGAPTSISDGTNAFTLNTETATDSYICGSAFNSNSLGGNFTITVTFSASATNGLLNASEYSGVAISSPLDGTPVAASTSGTSISAGNITTTQNGDLIWSGLEVLNSGTPTAGPGFTERGTQYPYVEDQVQAAAGAIDPSWSNSASSGLIAVAAAFKAAGGGGPTCPHTRSLLGVGC